MEEGGQMQHMGGEKRCSRKECFLSDCGRQTNSLREWSNSNLVALLETLRVGQWQALILPSDCLCQRFVRQTFWEFSMLNVQKVTENPERLQTCEAASVLQRRITPLPIALVACGLCYRQTGVKLATHAINNISFAILLDVSCHTEASVLFPWCAVVSWQKFTCWRSRCVCVAQRLTLWADMTFPLRAGGWDGCCELALCRYLVAFFDIA